MLAPKKPARKSIKEAAGVSTDAVARRTGKSWDDWFEVLDTAGAATLDQRVQERLVQLAQRLGKAGLALGQRQERQQAGETVIGYLRHASLRILRQRRVPYPSRRNDRTSRIGRRARIPSGVRRGVLRLSAMHRMRVIDGSAYHTPSARASAEWGMLALVANVEGRGIDSIARQDVSARFAPLGFARAGASVANVLDQSARGPRRRSAGARPAAAL